MAAKERVLYEETYRKGAMMKPQGRGKLFDGTSTCAIGAAMDAVGIRFPIGVSTSRAYDALRARWPFLTSRIISDIWYRNDTQFHTREQIADWVATIEAAQEVHEPVQVLVQS